MEKPGEFGENLHDFVTKHILVLSGKMVNYWLQGEKRESYGCAHQPKSPMRLHNHTRYSSDQSDGCVHCQPKVLDANSRTLLRKLEGHKSAVHVTKYSVDGLHVFSGSDDITARWWDISSGEQVMRLDGHRDYIRAAAQSTTSESQWATGTSGFLFGA